MKYTINKGNHYSNFTIDRLFPFCSLKQTGTFSLSKECWHRRDSIEYTGFNKLTGIAQLFGIHQNSGRLVWQPDFNNENVFNISGYVYSNGGKWEAKALTKVVAGRFNLFDIRWVDGYWIFSVNETSISMKGDKPKGLKRKCWPYFGGKSVAPQTMTMKIN